MSCHTSALPACGAIPSSPKTGFDCVPKARRIFKTRNFSNLGSFTRVGNYCNWRLSNFDFLGEIRNLRWREKATTFTVLGDDELDEAPTTEGAFCCA